MPAMSTKMISGVLGFLILFVLGRFMAVEGVGKGRHSQGDTTVLEGKNGKVVISNQATSWLRQLVSFPGVESAPICFRMKLQSLSLLILVSSS